MKFCYLYIAFCLMMFMDEGQMRDWFFFFFFFLGGVGGGVDV